MAPQSQRLTLDLRVERFAYRSPFRISGHVFTETALLVAALSDGEPVGRGEGAGVYYLGDDADHMLAERCAERGGGKECVSKCGSRLSVLPYKQKISQYYIYSHKS